MRTGVWREVRSVIAIGHYRNLTPKKIIKIHRKRCSIAIIEYNSLRTVLERSFCLGTLFTQEH